MSERVVWSGKYVETVVDGSWEYVRRTGDRGAAVVIAVTDADELVLVEQYRVPLGRRCIELPAGLIDDGEDTCAAAIRELHEEAGYRAASVSAIGVFASSPGLASESFTLVRAEGLTQIGDGGGIDGEDIVVHLVPVADLPRFIEEKRNADVMIDVRLMAGLRLL